MNNQPAAALPTIFVFCADTAARGRADEFFRDEVFAECVVAVEAASRPPADLAGGATLLLADGSYRSDDAATFDFRLAPSCTDDELRIAVRLLALVAVLRDSLSSAKHNESALQQLAAIDPLTQLANRRTWDEELARYARNAATLGEPLTVAIVDLDRFKQVNDAHGHAVGDAVLRAAADGLRRAVRRGDLAARIGGDEFGLLLPGLPAAAAEPVVERIRHAVLAAILGAGLPPTTCCLGFAAALGNAVVAETLYAAAAGALQNAKRAGGGRSVG